MIIIVEGKKYDTEKAMRIDTYSYERSSGSFEYYDEELYLSKKGNFFLYAYANENFPHINGVSIAPDEMEKIIPFSKEEALLWCQSRNRTETIRRHF